MSISSIPANSRNTAAQAAFARFKAIVEATKENGDLFEVTLDSHHLSGNLYARDIKDQNMVLEANVNEGDAEHGWKESTERWEVFSADGVDNLMSYTNVPMDGSPGIAQLYHGNFRISPKA